MAQQWVQPALAFLAAPRGWPEVGEAVQEFVCSVLYHITHRMLSGCVTQRTESDDCPGAWQVCSGAAGAEDPPQKEAGKGLLPVLSVSGGWAQLLL